MITTNQMYVLFVGRSSTSYWCLVSCTVMRHARSIHANLHKLIVDSNDPVNAMSLRGTDVVDEEDITKSRTAYVVSDLVDLEYMHVVDVARIIDCR